VNTLFGPAPPNLTPYQEETRSFAESVTADLDMKNPDALGTGVFRFVRIAYLP
jgi:hypothetical protein